MAQTLISDVYVWNNAMLAKDLQGATQIETQIAGENSAMPALLAEIAALNIPADAWGSRAAHTEGALAASKYATSFIAGGPRSDADLNVAGGAAMAAWRKAAAAVEPWGCILLIS